MNEPMPIPVEVLSWQLVHSLEPYIWWVKSGAAALTFGLLFFDSWKVSRVVLGLRYASMLGMLLIAYSWSNTAFGPLGDLVYWFFYALYRVALAWKLLPAIRARMALQPKMPEMVVWNYLWHKQLPELTQQKVID